MKHELVYIQKIVVNAPKNYACTQQRSIFHTPQRLKHRLVIVNKLYRYLSLINRYLISCCLQQYRVNCQVVDFCLKFDTTTITAYMTVTN